MPLLSSNGDGGGDGTLTGHAGGIAASECAGGDTAGAVVG